MQLKLLPSILTCLSVGFVIFGCAGTSSVNFGDGSTGNLVYGAVHHYWEEKDLNKALLFCDKAEELHGAEAKAMQASLSGYPATDPPEATYRYKTLNDVGLTTFLKGQILMDKGDPAGARAAFNAVVQDYGYAQIQASNQGLFGKPDADGFFGKPDADGFIKLADAAKARLAAM